MVGARAALAICAGHELGGAVGSKLGVEARAVLRVMLGVAAGENCVKHATTKI